MESTDALLVAATKHVEEARPHDARQPLPKVPMRHEVETGFAAPKVEEAAADEVQRQRDEEQEHEDAEAVHYVSICRRSFY